MTARPEASIVVPTWNTRDLLADCLHSIERTSYELRTETIVVDNASTDGTDEMVREQFPAVRLIRNRDNRGFAGAANQAARCSAAPSLLFLNSDAQLRPGALSALLALLDAQPQAGVVGALVCNPDGSLQSSYACFPSLAQEFLVLSGLGRLLFGPQYPSAAAKEPAHPAAVDWVSGACMLVRRSMFDGVGGFDEEYFMYAEDVDLCYRLRQRGWEVWYQPAAQIIHVGGASSKARLAQRETDLYRSRVRFFRKHYGRWAALTLMLEMCGLTALKIPMHATARLLSGGRYGRRVVPLRQLAAALRDA